MSNERGTAQQREAEKAERSPLLQQLRSSLGVESGPVGTRDPVNQAMIRHWCDAMQDHNPVYTDSEIAARSPHGEIVAPPSMLQAWVMPGLAPRLGSENGSPVSIYDQLDQAGFTSVVATNCEHEYPRYLRLGDHLHSTAKMIDVSEEKKTALGVGHFVTSLTQFYNQDDEKVGSLLFRILKFKPGTGHMAAGSGGDASPRPARPRPGISHDNRFFWDGIQQGELRIQECSGCKALHHPPRVRCPGCGSHELGHRVASGRGTLYSFVEPVHPAFPAFDPPYVVGLVELAEGTRILSNIIDVEPARVYIGMDLELGFKEVADDFTLHQFRPARPPRRESTLRFEDVEVGQELAPCPIPITPTLIVSTAIASRDYQDVHHDRDLAIKRGSPDIFMNILTSGGLCARYLTDWAGPEAILRSLKIRLGVPNYPYDTMTMYGSVRSVDRRGGKGIVEVAVQGANRLGNHVTGSFEIELPARTGVDTEAGSQSS